MKNIDRICIGSFSNTKIDILRKEFKDNLCSSMTKSETILFFLNRLFSIYDNSIPCLQIPMTYMGFRIVTSDLVEHVHSLGKKIHVWTINDENQIVVDPHTAVGIGAVRKLGLEKNCVVLSTAHPCKFPKAIEDAISKTENLPDSLKYVNDREEKFEVLPNDLEKVKNYIMNSI